MKKIPLASPTMNTNTLIGQIILKTKDEPHIGVGILMRKIYVVILAQLLLAALTAGASYAKDASKGPKIVLEQEEVTLMRDGKEIKHMNVSKKEAGAIIKGIREKVLKKLGLTSEGEAIDRNLDRKFADEMNKKVRVRELDSPELIFIDASGNVVKKLDLKSGSRREVKKSHPKLKPYLIEEYCIRYATISDDRKYALYSESLSEGLIPENEQEMKLQTDADTGHLETTTVVKYFDANGRLLWERHPPPDMRVTEAQIADGGSITAYLQDSTEIDSLQENQPSAELVVVGKDGGVLFSFPAAGSEYVHWDGAKLLMASSGRYLCTVGWRNSDHSNYCFDVNNKTTWASNEYYDVRGIRDDGKAEVSYADARKKGRKIINLEKYLGE